jgi:hypothetical protein
MPYVFISYRRKDSNAMTDRIRGELARIFGRRQVFQDQHAIGTGEWWRQILLAIHRADVVLVIIGDQWEAEFANRSDPWKDYVRREIEHALSLGKPLIPVFVGHKASTMSLHTRDIPNELHRIEQFQGCIVRDSGQDFENDIAHLVDLIRATHPHRRHWLAVLVALFALFIGVAYASFVPNVNPLSAPSTWLANIMADATATPSPTFDVLRAFQTAVVPSVRAETGAVGFVPADQAPARGASALATVISAFTPSPTPTAVIRLVP